MYQGDIQKNKMILLNSKLFSTLLFNFESLITLEIQILIKNHLVMASHCHLFNHHFFNNCISLYGYSQLFFSFCVCYHKSLTKHIFSRFSSSSCYYILTPSSLSCCLLLSWLFDHLSSFIVRPRLFTGKQFLFGK